MSLNLNNDDAVKSRYKSYAYFIEIFVSYIANMLNTQKYSLSKIPAGLGIYAFYGSLYAFIM